MKTVERHKKTDFGDVWYVNAADGTYRFAVYKYDDDDDTIYLSNVFVKEDSRRQGYGNEILASAEEYANRLGASVICLKVLSGSDVHRWYKRHGYEDLEKDEEERGYMWMKKELKRVNESIWSNINKRSEGNLERKEDDVNNLDYIGFYDYLLDKYKDKVEYIDYRDSSKGSVSHIIVNVVNGLELSINYSNNKIYNILINCSNGVSFNPDTISEYLRAGELQPNVYEVVEKNGEMFNSTFLKLIDFFIHNIDVLEISESIWSNINKRSEGNLERKEDDIDHLDFEQFYEYLNNRYQPCYVNHNIKRTTGSLDYIDVPLFCGRTMSHLAIYKNKKIKPYIFIMDIDLYPEFIDALKLNYDITIDYVDKGCKSIYIYEKGKRDQDEQNTNSFYVQLIDYILDMDKPKQLKNMLERNVNESIWSNINKRSEGNIERKEDDVNILDLEEFYEYIKKHYKNKVEYIDLDAMGGGNGDVLGVDITENIILFYKPKRGHILLSWSKVKIPMPFFDEFTDKFKVENPNALRRIITEKDGSCTNKTFIDVINFFIEHKKILINESIWSNINKRSEGNLERKEDDINILNGEGFAEYLKKLYKNVDTPYHIFIDVEDIITVPIIKYKGQTICVYYDCTNNIVYGRFDFLYYHDPDLFEKLRKDYKTFMLKKSFSNYVRIEPRVGELSNEFFIEIIDFYLENCDTDLKKILVKNVNESIWSSINKRSEGNQERKEESLNEFEKKALTDYRTESFAYDFVYEEKYKNTLEGYKSYIDNFYKNSKLFEETPKELVYLFIENHWDKISKNINDYIKNEEDFIESMGFKRGVLKSVKGTLDYWWKNLDDEQKEDVLYFHNKDAQENEDKEYETYKDIDEFWRWANYHEKIDAYMRTTTKTNESIWSNINKRSEGNQERVEDQDPEMKEKIMSYCRWFANKIVYEDAYKNDLDDFKKFLYDQNKSFTHYIKRLQQMNNYVEARWMTFKDVIDENIEKLEKKVESQGFKKVPGESICDTLEKWWDAYEYKDDELDAVNNDLDYNERFMDENEMWDQWDYDEKIECYMNAISQTNECDGVPGGLTPADVGGMGPAYFPGPNGEPGSGDLPMPTGHVYQQVAPFGIFIRTKKGKKRKKKFRKEDEPCVHSENPPIYSHVDDFRDYVDRVYNQIDRNK